MTNLLGLPECYGLPVREERPNALEYTAAEYWVREAYRRWWQDAGGVPQLITWQLDRLFETYPIEHPVLELAMELLESDFRNVFTDSVRRRFASMMKNGATDVEVLKLIREAAPGGPRKPDMLGISAAGGPLLFDAVEVGTVKTDASTYKELNDKLDIIRSAVVPQLRLRMPALQAQAARRSRTVSLPTDYVVRASPFRLKPSEMVLPVPVRVAPANGPGGRPTVDWVCYHPTTVWAPSGTTPAPGSGAPTGTDGMVIYHIHRAELPRVPDRVRNRVATELKRLQQSQGAVLELNPALVGAFVADQSAWTPEGRRMFAYLGAGALVLVFVAVAWEVGVFAGGVALADAGLSAAAAAPAEVLGLVRASAGLASQLWPAAVSAVPLMPQLAR